MSSRRGWRWHLARATLAACRAFRSFPNPWSREGAPARIRCRISSEIDGGCLTHADSSRDFTMIGDMLDLRYSFVTPDACRSASRCCARSSSVSIFPDLFAAMKRARQQISKDCDPALFSSPSVAERGHRKVTSIPSRRSSENFRRPRNRLAPLARLESCQHHSVAPSRAHGGVMQGSGRDPAGGDDARKSCISSPGCAALRWRFW